MAVEVGRQARQVVGKIVLGIRHDSILLGLKTGTSLNVPLMYPLMYPLLYPLFVYRTLCESARVWSAPLLKEVVAPLIALAPAGALDLDPGAATAGVVWS